MTEPAAIYREYYVIEVTLPPELFHAWDFPSSNKVQHPPCAGAQEVCLTRPSTSEVSLSFAGMCPAYLSLGTA